MRSLTSLACLALLFTGCAFEEGEPWGEVRASLTLAFEPAAPRRTEEGWLKTTTSYGVELHTLRVDVQRLTLAMAAGGADATIFDPSDPPPGYSLCHNGHCHADSGALVPYGEIADEIGAEAPGSGLTVEIPGGGALAITGGTGLAALGACPDDCALPRGRLASMEVLLTGLYVQATIHDLLPEDQARLPPEGLPVEVDLALTGRAEDVLNVTFGKGRKVGARLDARLDLGETLFDGIDWSDGDVNLRDAVEGNLAEGMALTVDVDRY